MRSVEHTLCALSVALLAAGCASNPGPVQDQAAASAPAAAAKAASGTAVAPVDAAAQRSFDEARRALAAGQTAEAEARFLALTQSNPELGGPFASLGLIYQQAGKTSEAVLQFEAAVKASPQQPAYLNQLGVAYRQMGQFDKAREAYERAIALAPDHATAMLNLGILNDLYLGDPARALELYERYLLLTPAGDATVSKWVVDLKNRKPQTVAAKGKS
jgi:tetratricopeptide (TPR) repeat protein